MFRDQSSCFLSPAFLLRKIYSLNIPVSPKQGDLISNLMSYPPVVGSTRVRLPTLLMRTLVDHLRRLQRTRQREVFVA